MTNVPEVLVLSRMAGRRRPRIAAATLVALTALALASGAAGAPPHAAALSGPERAFAKAYVALVPGLNKLSGAVAHAVKTAGTNTDAQIVVIFTGLAKRWGTTTKPLLALKAPSQEASLFAAVTRYVPAIKSDLVAIARTGRTHNVADAKAAGKQLGRDFNGLGAAVTALRKKLGLH